MTVVAYRITPDDLEGGEKKTIATIEPLLASLNQSLSPLVTQFNALPTSGAVASTFTTSNLGAAYLDVLTGSIDDLWIGRIYPSDGTILDSVWSMSWTALTGTTARVRFVGLAPSTKYNVRIKWQ